MPLEQRTKLKSTQDWYSFLNSGTPITLPDLFKLRIKSYQEIEVLRGRPLLVYASQALGELCKGRRYQLI